jgi:transcriptional regulator NrdR family protein
MSLAVDIVKRRGKRPSEQFNTKKLHSSVYAACLSVRSPEGHADQTATHVCSLVETWCTNKPEVTSADIRRQAAKALAVYHPEAAYLYQHHRVIL